MSAKPICKRICEICEDCKISVRRTFLRVSWARNSLIQVPHVLKGDNECHFVTEISQIYSNLTNLLMSFNISERKDAEIR